MTFSKSIMPPELQRLYKKTFLPNGLRFISIKPKQGNPYHQICVVSRQNPDIPVGFETPSCPYKLVMPKLTGFGTSVRAAIDNYSKELPRKGSLLVPEGDKTRKIVYSIG